MTEAAAKSTVDIDPEFAEQSKAARGSLEDQLSTFSASLTSSVTNYPFLYGRRYHAYKDGSYILPNDEQEQERLDTAHAMATKLIGDKLYLAPIPDGFSGRILDIGCGTGIWSIAVGDLYPSADVLGVDLSPIQPSWVPSNVKFEVDDIEEDWTFGQPFDYIFCRYLMSSVRDWPKLVKNAYDNVRPGGWVEFQDYDATIYSEDGSFKPEHAMHKWISTFIDAATASGRDPSPGKSLEQWIRAAGFTNVHHQAFKLPIGAWAKDRRKKEAGMFNLIQVNNGIEGFTMRLFTEFLKWDAEEVKAFVAKAKENLNDKSVHMIYD